MQSEHRQLADRLLEKKEIKCGRMTFVSGRIGIRRVNLEGEAYFEVRHNNRCPFVVEAQTGVRTRVLSTKFNVCSHEVEKRVITTLFEGAVRMFLQD